MNNKFWSGISLVIVSYCQVFLPYKNANFLILSLFWASFMLGIILIGEGLTSKLQNRSLLRIVQKNRKAKMTFILVSIVGGVCLEGIAQWIGKLWVYPYFSNWTYLAVFIPGFILYWLMIAESYLGVKAIIDRYLRSKRKVTKYYSYEAKLYPLLGFVGTVLIIIALLIARQAYIDVGGYVFSIRTIENININFYSILSLFVGVWFIAEFYEYKRRETSLIKDVLHHYDTPIFAIIFGSVSLAMLMEINNLLHGYWQYVHWPYDKYNFLGLPLVMLLIAWPLHYIMFLSLFRAITPTESVDILRNPTKPPRKK